MGQLVNIMEPPVRRLTFGEMGDSYPEGKLNALGDDAASVNYRKKFIDGGTAWANGSMNPFFFEATRTVDGAQVRVVNADDNYRIQCSYFECYSIQDLYRFYIEPNIILAYNKLKTITDDIERNIDDIEDNIDAIEQEIVSIKSTFVDNSSAAASQKDGIVSKTQWSGRTGSPVKFVSGRGYVSKASTGTLGVVKKGTNTSIGSDGAVNVATANGSTLGVVKQGDHVTISNGTISVPIATTGTLGVIKVGANLNIGTDGKLNAVDTNTTYPAADDRNSSTLGTVKPGGDISWKNGVGTVRGYGGFKMNPDGGEVLALPAKATPSGDSREIAYLNLEHSNDFFYESPFTVDRNDISVYLSGPRKIIYPVDPGRFTDADLNESPVKPWICKSELNIRFDYDLIEKALDNFGILDIELEFLHNVFSRTHGSSAAVNTNPALLLGLTWGGFRLFDYTGFLETVQITYIRPIPNGTPNTYKEVSANIFDNYESGGPFTKSGSNGGVTDDNDKYTPIVCIPTYVNKSIDIYCGKSLNFRFKKIGSKYLCDIYPHYLCLPSSGDMVTPDW